jgi:hypothetical protein
MAQVGIGQEASHCGPHGGYKSAVHVWQWLLMGHFASLVPVASGITLIPQLGGVACASV